LEHQ
ncbi:hypothetical protein D049_1287B, partial [Vibrio parahaemolyticus VPTS-2010]|jgi:hypothetical protein